MSEIHISEKHFIIFRPDRRKSSAKRDGSMSLLDKLKIPYEGVDHDVAGTMGRMCYC